MCNETKHIVIGISGASGAIYGIRLLELLKPVNYIKTHLVISDSAKRTIELETSYATNNVIKLADFYYDAHDIAATISSGSYKIHGMIVVPCSIKTLSGIANSYSDNLLIRAADVTLKEGRKLILCIRETPLHLGHLKLMITACEIGATIMPLVPAFYHQPSSINELIEQSLIRMLNQLNIELTKKYQWKSKYIWLK